MRIFWADRRASRWNNNCSVPRSKVKHTHSRTKLCTGAIHQSSRCGSWRFAIQFARLSKLAGTARRNSPQEQSTPCLISHACKNGLTSRIRLCVAVSPFRPPFFGLRPGLQPSSPSIRDRHYTLSRCKGLRGLDKIEVPGHQLGSLLPFRSLLTCVLKTTVALITDAPERISPQ